MAQYRYLSYDLRTNTLQEELPLAGVKFGEVLNGAGSFSATLQLNVQAQSAPGVFASRAAALLTATTTGRSVVYVERDGVLIPGAAFIVWTRNYVSSTMTCTLGGQSLWSYFRHRFNNVTLGPYSGVDQLTIGQNLINSAQAQPGGSIGVAVGAETSGVPRDRTYNGYEHKQIAEAVEQLSAVNNGFDFGIDVAYVAGVPTKTFRCSYPRRGRTITDSGHVFEVGRNIVSYTYPEDATSQANRTYVVGAGDGADMLVGTQSRTDSLDAGWPLLEAQAAAKDVTVQATVDAQALALVNAKAWPVTIPKVTVSASTDPVLGAWIVGDDARFVFGTAGNDPRFPARTEQIYRIVGYECEPGDEGQELVTLTLN